MQAALDSLRTAQIADMNSEPPRNNAPPDGDRGHGEPYVKNTNEWVSRCRARLLRLDPTLRAEDADAQVWDMGQFQQWRS